MPSSAPTETCLLSLHDALPISVHYSLAKGACVSLTASVRTLGWVTTVGPTYGAADVYVDGKLVKTVSTHAASTGYRKIEFVRAWRSEEHTSELQSHSDLVCRLPRPPRPASFPYTTLFRSRSTTRWPRARACR